jgi:hypothetical protein
MSRARDIADKFSPAVAANVANIATGSSTDIVTTTNDLPVTGNEIGDVSFVDSANRLFMWTGTGWYNIALVNEAPSITSVTDSDGNTTPFSLSTDGTPTVITVAATDPEDIPLTWSYEITSGLLGNTATISQEDNIFTITPSTNDSDAGAFAITFKASDGISIGTSLTSFTLAFSFNVQYNSKIGFVEVGTKTYISASNSAWAEYTSNLPAYLQGALGTLTVNTGNTTVTVGGAARIWLLRQPGWDAVSDIANYTSYGTTTGAPLTTYSADFDVYYRDVAAGTYTLDTQSGMYFFTFQSGKKTGVLLNGLAPADIPPFAGSIKGYWTTKDANSYSGLSTWQNLAEQFGTGLPSYSDATLSTVTEVADGIGTTTTYPILRGTRDGASIINFGPQSTVTNSDNWTVIHLTRYTPGGYADRIILGASNNILIGHWTNAGSFSQGGAGIAYMQGWVTPQNNPHGFDWFIGAARHSNYRTNGIVRGSSGAGSYNTELGIGNYGQQPTERSDFDIALMLVYDRRLSDTEIAEVETWVNEQFDLQITLGS